MNSFWNGFFKKAMDVSPPGADAAVSNTPGGGNGLGLSKSKVKAFGKPFG